MTRISLTQDEEYLLKRYFHHCPIELIRSKSLAIQMRVKGEKLVKISEYTQRNQWTISRWVKDFSQRRTASIFSGKVNNENASKLTRKQKKQICKVLQQPPSRYGLPKEFWDVPILKEYVEARFGVVYESTRSYHFLLRFSNLSFKYPDVFSYQRDEKLIERRMQQIRGEIIPSMADTKWEVFVVDESRIILEALTRRAWLKKGQRTVIKVNRKREYQNYFGALNQKSFRCHVFEIAWQNQEEIIQALEKLLGNIQEKESVLSGITLLFTKARRYGKD